MLELGISLAFGLTVGIIMSLVLWLNTKFNIVELFMILIFVLLSSIVWNFTSGKFTDVTLLALMFVWSLARLLIDKWRVFEKILTFTMSTIIVLNYYIYLTFIGLRVHSGISYASLIYMIVYLAIIAAVYTKSYKGEVNVVIQNYYGTHCKCEYFLEYTPFINKQSCKRPDKHQCKQSN
ncbi:MAG: hypothetical protein IIT49_00340, partial [Clostridia bacterium]|nr:hypothetical protein [Clostridia bacterium]